MSKNQKPESKSFLIGGAIALTLMLSLSAWAWMRLPEGKLLPVHWNAAGHVDRFGSKAETLLMLPGILVVMIIVFCVIPLIEPRKQNLANSWKVFQIARGASLVVMTIVHLVLVLKNTGVADFDMGRIMILLTGLLFIVLGNFLGKTRSNFFMGVRTPWTLSSELSWTKTNRAGGWMFFLWGLVMVACALANIQKPLPIFGSFIIGVCALIPYFYFVWKSDPNRQDRAEPINHG